MRRGRMGSMPQAGARTRRIVLSIGHSIRTQKEFIALLQAHNVKRLVDVRTIPRSRHNPQFNHDRIARALRRARISYLHMAGLGGFRHARRDSPNTAWRNASFRGFADYMQTRDFVHSLRSMMKIARHEQTAIMCAEAVPWRCHRSLIADALLVRGCPVEEIESVTRTRPHTLTPWARVQGTRITYPPEAATQAEESDKKGGSHAMIKLKRVYEPASSSDRPRYLVERLWPRGVKKTALHIDAWLKDVAPSTTLRRWFNHDPKKWDEFRRRYRRELDANLGAIEPLLKAAQRGLITLVYSSHDTEHNNAVALKEYVENKLGKKPVPLHKPAA